MKASLSLIVILCISYSLSLPASDSDLENEELASDTESNAPYIHIDENVISEIRSKSPPDYESVESIEEGISWLECILPLIEKIEKRMDNHYMYDEPIQFINEAIEVWESLQNISPQFLPPKLSKNMPHPLHEAIRIMSLLYCKLEIGLKMLEMKWYFYENFHVPIVDGESEKFEFFETLYATFIEREKLQTLYKAFDHQVPTEDITHQQTKRLLKNPYASFRKIGQSIMFINDVRHFDDSRTRFLPWGDESARKRKFSSMGGLLSEPYLIHSGTSSKLSEEPVIEANPSQILDLAVFDIIPIKTEDINEKVSEWRKYMGAGNTIDTNDLETSYENDIIPYLHLIETIMCVFPETGKSLYEQTFKTLNDIRDVLLWAGRWLPMTPDNFVYPQARGHRVFSEHHLLHRCILMKNWHLNLNRESKYDCINFISSNDDTARSIENYRTILEIRSAKKTASTLLEESIFKFCQRSTASLEDLEQFVLINKKYWYLIEKGLGSSNFEDKDGMDWSNALGVHDFSSIVLPDLNVDTPGGEVGESSSRSVHQ